MAYESGLIFICIWILIMKITSYFYEANNDIIVIVKQSINLVSISAFVIMKGMATQTEKETGTVPQHIQL